MNFVRMMPFSNPQAVPTANAVSITTMNGAPVLQTMQAIVAERQTVAPTEMSISPNTNKYAIGNIKNISARYLGISRSTLLA